MSPQALPFLQFFAVFVSEAQTLSLAMQLLPQGFPFLHSFANAVVPVIANAANSPKVKIKFFIKILLGKD